MNKIRDIDIRKEYLRQFPEEFNEIFVNEYSLGKNIADMISVKDGYIHIYEIKSETDTTSRLRKQISTYKKLADKITLIVHKKHLHELLPIDGIKPKEIDLSGLRLIVAEKSGQTIQFTEMQPQGLFKPKVEFILQNCWRDDILRIAYYLKIIPKIGGSKYLVMEKLKGKVKLEDAKKALIARLKLSYIKTCFRCNSQLVRNTSSNKTYVEHEKSFLKLIKSRTFRVTETEKFQQCFKCGHEQNKIRTKQKYLI